MRLSPFFKSIFIAALVLLAAGCAKTDVRSTRADTNTGLPAPHRVLITDFAVSPADVRENAGIFARTARTIENTDQTAEELQLGRDVADALAAELAVKIADMGLNAVRASAGTPLTTGAILIVGHFINIDEGNRLRRNIIGLGMGKSSIDCEVSVLAPGSAGWREITAFDAHIDSGKMPGVAVLGPAGKLAGADTETVVAANAGISGVKIYRSAALQQAKSMADKIAGSLATYFARQGWIRPNLAK
jgi:hypothetical protein